VCIYFVSLAVVSVPPPEPYGDFDMLDPGQQMLGTWAPSPEYSLRTTIPHVKIENDDNCLTQQLKAPVNNIIVFTVD